jgi:hypothetical protein
MDGHGGRSATFFLPIEPKSCSLCLSTPCHPSSVAPPLEHGLMCRDADIFLLLTPLSTRSSPQRVVGGGNAWMTLGFTYLVHLHMILVFTACHACAGLPSPFLLAPPLMDLRDDAMQLTSFVYLSSSQPLGHLAPLRAVCRGRTTNSTRDFSGNNNKVRG